MYVVLELEHRICNGELEYVNSRVFKCNSLEDGLTIIQQKKEETFKRGYFTEITYETSKTVAFHNGSAYKRYILEGVEEVR